MDFDWEEKIDVALENAAEEQGLIAYPVVWDECANSDLKRDINVGRRNAFIKAFRQGAGWMQANQCSTFINKMNQNTTFKNKLDEALKLIGELEKAMVLLVDRQEKAEKELKNKGASFTSDMLVRNLKAKITKIKDFKDSLDKDMNNAI